MADGVLGEGTRHALRAVELDVKQKLVVALILLHLKEEINATDHQLNRETVILMHAQVCMLLLKFSLREERHQPFLCVINVNFCLHYNHNIICMG